ncbi:LysR family transcriptional regulator [Rhizobium rhizophilum]|uniref:LysR family transcriptional regulator n=1 Tax=Rhizobium rhizophilum TaxID=1850373 RepID=A0ABY2QV39_9HYPH|nr:LysR family transcriptional regulator [Rhizobium rhizophilum]
MDIRFLQSLVSVVETGSIISAARREKLTSAAISQRVQALERSLGTTLLVRHARSVAPTEACLLLLPRIRHLIREASLLRDDLDERQISGEMRIGAISTVMTGLMPDLLHTAAQVAPRLKLRLVPGTSLLLYEQLMQGHLDAALLVEPPFVLPKSLKAVALHSEPLVLMTHDPVDQTRIRDRIEAGALIRYDPLSWGGRLATAYLDRERLFPEVLCDMDALEAIAILVERGLGISLVPAWQGTNQKASGIHLTRLPDSESLARQIVLLHPATPARPKALALLCGLLVNGGRDASIDEHL